MKLGRGEPSGQCGDEQSADLECTHGSCQSDTGADAHNGDTVNPTIRTAKSICGGSGSTCPRYWIVPCAIEAADTATASVVAAAVINVNQFEPKPCLT
jgi:hypothetical protein